MSKRRQAIAPFRSLARRASPLALLLATTALTSPLLIDAAIAQNLPTGGSVAAGSVAIAQPSATQLTVTQSSQSAVVNWQGFSVGQGSAVNIVQPNASSAILNRVTGTASSTIAGSITANGSVYLVNPNGIAITQSGTVNAGGGFVASALGISDSDFMSGKRTFTGNGASAGVSNAGTITVGRGGYAALIGGTVSNSGSINVPLGKVGLGSGEQATLDFSGDGFLQVAVPTSAGGKRALVRNSGSIKADGGSVIISAATAREAARNAINISGTVQARSISGSNGSITIGGGAGGRVKVTGRLDASSATGSGGKINVTGRDIKLKGAVVDASGKTGGGINIGGGRQGQGPLQRAQTTTIDATTTIKADATQSGNGGNVVVWSDNLTTFAGTISARGGVLSGNGGDAEVSGKAKLSYTGFTNLSAANGRFGTLLLDPYNVIISNGADTGGFTATADDSVINATTLSNALGGANVTVTTGTSGLPGTQDGNITVAAPVAWSAPTTLTLTAANAIAVNSTISVQGAGGVALDYNTASPTNLKFGNGASVDYGATNNGGTLSVNGQSYALVYSMVGLAGISSSGRSALATNLDSTTIYTTPSVIVPNYSGTFEGLGHTISNLTINNTNFGANTGLFSQVIGGTIRDLGLVGGSIIGGNQSRIGALAGQLFASSGGASIVNSWSTASVTGGGGARVGGLVGQVHASSGTTLIASSYSTGNVTTGATTGQGAHAGGLVGLQQATNANATITGSHASGVVTGGSNATLGGLVGHNVSSGQTAAIVDSYATGIVGSSNANTVGGLVGTNATSAGTSSITRSFATGAVFGGGVGTGGLVGHNNANATSQVGLVSITDSYATGAVSGRSGGSGGLVGVNDALNSGGAISINTSYATGRVTASGGPVGALIGTDQRFAGGNTTITSSYWDVTTSGIASAGVGSNNYGGSPSATGLTTAQFQNGTLPTNFSSSVWATGAGLYPYLSGIFATAPQVVSGFAYTDAGLTALASGTAGAVTVGVIANGSNFGSATTGANGYYYAFAAAGSAANGASLLAYTATGTAAATLSTVTNPTLQTGLNLYGNALTVPTSATALSAAPTLVKAQASATAAAGGNAAAITAINGLVGRGFLASGASFAVDENIASSNTFFVQTTAANAGITVSNPIAIDSGGSLGLNAAGALAINAPITVAGAGSVALAASFDTTTAQGVSLLNLSFAPGASIDYGTANNGGSLIINGQSYGLIYSMAQLAAINGTGDIFAIATDLTPSSGYTGSVVGSFGGILTGLGHSITNLSITNAANFVEVGLIGTNNGTIRDLNLVGGSVTTTGDANIGALVGYNLQGVVANVSSSATVTGSFQSTGGLVGRSYAVLGHSAIVNASATGAVSGTNTFVGGLVGFNESRNNYAATIANSFATGMVSAITFGNAGGLVGVNQAVDGGKAPIANSFATGSVHAPGSSSVAGGLVGSNAAVRGGSVASLTNVYATGPVSGSTAGGLIGINGANDVATTPLVNAYWNTTTSGRGNGIGTDDAGVAPTALTTTDLQSGALPAGFSSSLWTTGNGLYPYLTSFFPNGIQVVTGTAFTDAGITPSSGANAQRSVGVIVGGTSFGTSALGADGSYYVFGAAGTITGGSTLLSHNNTSGATLMTTSGVAVHYVNLYGDALTVPTNATSLSMAPSLADARTTALAAAGGNIAAQTAINAATGRGFFATNNAGFTIDESVAVASGSTFLVQTTAGGALTVSNAVTIDGTGSLGLLSSGKLAINAPINVNGAGGVNLAFNLTSPTNLTFAHGASIDYGATDNSGKLAINGANYTLLYNMGDVAGVNTAGLTGNYAVATNIDASGTTYTTGVIAGGDMTGIWPTPFSGIFEGLGHTISNLTINQASNTSVGLIGYSTGAVRDIGIVGGSIAGFANVGSLVGHNNGGLVANAYATSAVTGGLFSGNLGGLVGYNNGGLVTNAYATGAVRGGGASVNLGGLVGTNTGTVTNAYATGAVFGGSSSRNLGGLVGYNDGGQVANAYATGAVSGGANSMSLGGLVGTNLFLVSNGYWDMQTSGQSTGIGSDSFGQTVTGLTTRQLQGLDPINGNALSVVNNLGDGATSAFSGGANGLYPYLSSFFPNGVQAVSGFVYRDVVDTPLASGANGAVTVNVIGGGNAFGSATTGANGYYYAFGAAGSIANGAALLTYTTANVASGAKGSATLATLTSTPNQAGVNLYNGALTATTSEVTLSAADPVVVAAATTAANGNAAALSAISGAAGRYYIATGASFSIDRAVTTSNVFAVSTIANAPLTVNDTITINDGGSLGLFSGGRLAINADIKINGAGSVALAYDASSLNALLMNFSFAPGRSLTFNDDNGNPTATAVAGQRLAVNGQNYALLYSMADVDGVDGVAASSNPINVQAGGNSGLYALAHSLDATGVTYTDALIGNYAGTLAQFRFTGTFQGLGHTITGLTINKNDAFAGLFGVIGSETVLGQNGIVRDIGLIGGSVAGTNQVGPLAGYNHSRVVNGYATGTASGSSSVGGLLGGNDGSIMNAYATGAVVGDFFAGGLTGANSGYIIDAYATGAVRSSYSGGLAGNNRSGTILNAYATGAVTGYDTVGGLVGSNSGDGIIRNSYATGAVSGFFNVGGLVGLNGGFYGGNYGGELTNVHAMGAVSGAINVGGLVGYNGSVSSVATVTNAYAIGAVNGSAGGSFNVGGLIGLNDPNGTVMAGYFDRQTTGQIAGIGLDNNSQTVTGLTTAALQNGALPAGFDPAVWATGSGLYPYLTSFFPGGVQVVSGFAYTDGGVTLLASSASGAAYVSIASNGQTLSSVTTGANGYYYAFVPMGRLASTAGVAAYTQANTSTGAKDAVSYAGFTPSQVTSLDISGGWRRDTTLASSLTALDAGFATTTNGTPVASLALPNRAIFAINDFALDSALGVTGTLNLASVGNVTQTSAVSAGTLLLEGSNSTSFTLAHTGNRISQFAASGGATDVFSASSLTIAVNIANVCGCAVTGVTATGATRIATAGDLTIAAGASVSGDSPVLSAAGAFINNAGANAVMAMSGRWLVYSANSAGNTFGSLDSGNIAVWSTAADGIVTATGDRYVFAEQPNLTVAINGNASKIYGETVTLPGYTISGAQAGVSAAYLGDTLGNIFSGVAAVTSAGAAVTANAGNYAITASQGSLTSSAGYGFSFANGTLTVGQRAIAVTADAKSRTYGDANPALTYGVGGLGLVNGDTLSGSLTTAATMTSDVGSYGIARGSLAASANYAVTSYTGANLTVGQRAIAVTADAKSRTYGDANPALTYAVGGLGLANGDTLSGSLTTAATTTSDVGSYSIVKGSLAASANYAVTSYTGANLTVGQRAIAVTADAKSRTYGDANPALTYGVGGLGLVNGDTLSGSLTTAATMTSNVGSYGIARGSLAASANYAVTYTGANLTVGQRAIAVTADAKSRTYGDANPALTYGVGGLGLVNGDTLSGELATSANITSDAGAYSITQGTLAATSNYNLIYRSALLTVTAAPGEASLLASSVVRDEVKWLVLPDGATPLSGVPPIVTTFGTGVFYADPRFDAVFICFGGGSGTAPSCFVAR